MTFLVATLVDSRMNPFMLEDHILSKPQKLTLALDIMGVVGMVALAVWMLSNQASHPLGVHLVTDHTLSYILLGSAGGVALVDMVACAVQTSKKFDTLVQFNNTTKNGQF